MKGLRWRGDATIRSFRTVALDAVQSPYLRATKLTPRAAFGIKQGSA